MGIGITGLLTVALIVLKLCEVIDWSWVWVLAPAWGSAIVGGFILIVLAVVAAMRAKK